MLINLRNALMAGKRLPYDAEVEYLRNRGKTQRINTGIVGGPGLRVQTRIASFEKRNDTWAIWSYSVNARLYVAYQYKSGTDGGYWGGGYGTYFSGTADTEMAALGVFADLDVQFTDAYQILTVDGVERARWAKTNYTGTNVNPLWLFGHSSASFECAIGPTKIWMGGVLVRDYIPVRKGTVGYLYDRVSGKLFGNAGTGDFVLGPDVVPVEYLAPQTLTQAEQFTTRIDTGIAPTANTEVSAEMYPLNYNAGDQTIGARAGNSNSNRFFVYSMNSNGRFVFGNNSLADQYLTGQRFVVVFNETNTHKVLVNGLEKSTFDPSMFANQNQAKKIFLFATSGYEPVYGTSNTRIYWCKIRDNGVLVRSFRPVRVGTDATSWEGAMMDVLTRRIYRNAGTGAFTYGNDLRYPIPAE